MPMFDPKKTEALMEVVSTGSFEAAAKRLNVTTSAVSQRIRSLEAKMGRSLLIRSRPCRPKDAGAKLISHFNKKNAMDKEFLKNFLQGANERLRISIAVNNDSLSNWLLSVIAEFVYKKDILVSLIIDDQDYTLGSLESGLASLAVSSKQDSISGCTSTYLGCLQYRLACSGVFFEKFFKHGVNVQSLKKAPLLIFGIKDRLQSDFLFSQLGLLQEACDCHYIPSSEAYYESILYGVGYGMVPEPKYRKYYPRGELVDLCPGETSDIPLYLHAWKSQIELHEELCSAIVQASHDILKKI